MPIRIKLEGYDKLIDAISKSESKINIVADTCITKSANIMSEEIKSKMASAGVDDGLISRMPAPIVEHKGNIYSAQVGYKKGTYDPTNLSDGYKALFLNYGTPRRTEHGKVRARGFIDKAKKAAKPKIKKAQKQAIDDILKGIE